MPHLFEKCSVSFCVGVVAHLPQRPGYYTREGEFVFVKEMIPEFVVPDLTDFKVYNVVYSLFQHNISVFTDAKHVMFSPLSVHLLFREWKYKKSFQRIFVKPCRIMDCYGKNHTGWTKKTQLFFYHL